MRISAQHAFSIAYFVAGITLIVTSAQLEKVPVHAILLGVLNIIASCGVYSGRRWALYALAFISLINLTFGSILLAALTLFFSYSIIDILAFIGITLYVILSLTSLIYIVARANKFME